METDNISIIGTSYQNHDGGMCLIENGKVSIVKLSERYTRIKHDGYIIPFIEEFLLNGDNLSVMFISSINYDKSVEVLNTDKKIKIISEHHLLHAYCGFYSSNFDDALCIVMDGYGYQYENKNEVISAYLFENGKFSKEIDKIYEDFPLKENTTCSIGRKFAKMCETLNISDVGKGDFDSGKLMGLAQYYGNENKLPKEYLNEEWWFKVCQANELQRNSEEDILKLIAKYVKQTGVKNIVLSGGVFLNCVATYKILKNLNINLHVDPICNDNGICLGAAFKGYFDETGKIPERINHTYFGASQNEYNFENLKIAKVSYSNIIDLILDKNVVAIFQGQSEIGQRALGNRSLLFDPRVVEGKYFVNKIKNREQYRPFAASVLLEHVDNWFDIGESPFMSYASNAYENAIENVPAVIHADNTCRVQTVTQKQNYHFYNLINEFYVRTGIPMLLNTSFNLAGEPLVETFDDAKNILSKSELNFIYLPELNILVSKK